GFMIAGVESTTAPSGRLRKAVMTAVASATLRFMCGASVVAFATVIAVIVPLGSTVYRFRWSVVVPLAQLLPALSFVPGAHATQIRVPSAVNFQPDGWVSSPTAL